jgi:hypothetical protein
VVLGPSHRKEVTVVKMRVLIAGVLIAAAKVGESVVAPADSPSAQVATSESPTRVLS